MRIRFVPFAKKRTDILFYIKRVFPCSIIFYVHPSKKRVGSLWASLIFMAAPIVALCGIMRLTRIWFVMGPTMKIINHIPQYLRIT